MELGFIEGLQGAFNPSGGIGGIGDDGVFIPPHIYVSDTVVEGVHFFSTTPWVYVLELLFNSNISDMAAMGAKAEYAILNISTPPELLSPELTNIVADLCRKNGIHLIGGDTCGSPTSVLSLTLFGRVMNGGSEGNVLTRSGASAGDVIFISRPVGLTGITLANEALHHKNTLNNRNTDDGTADSSSVNSSVNIADSIAVNSSDNIADNSSDSIAVNSSDSIADSIADNSSVNIADNGNGATADMSLAGLGGEHPYHHYTRPPEVALGELLGGMAVVVGVGGVTACMDISDGIGVDMHRLAKSSGVRCVIHEAALGEPLQRIRTLLDHVEALPCGGSDVRVVGVGANDGIGAGEGVTEVSALDHFLGAGQEFALLFTVSKGVAEAVQERARVVLGREIIPIGWCEEQQGGGGSAVLIRGDGEVVDVSDRGWVHGNT